MKLKAATLRTFTTLHTWVGVVAGFALFVAFYAGAITVFHHELMLWQSPHAADRPVETLADAQRLLDQTLDNHPAARQWVGMLFPGEESHQVVIYWPDEQGTWRYATLDQSQAATQPPQASLSELVNALHFSLGIPVAGTYLMGIVSILFGIAIVSGVVIHLPALFKDLLSLRPGANLKRLWQDAHNVIGVLGLPMHLMFAITGAMLCLMTVVAVALDPLIYRGELIEATPAALDTAPVMTAAGQPARLAGLDAWQRSARREALAAGLEGFEPAYLKLMLAGDANARIEITGTVPRHLGATGTVALDATSGAVVASQLPGRRDANHAALTIAYLLHFGEYGNVLVRWLYFLLGIGGAFLFYSGNLLWVESRRRRREPGQTRSSLNLARATVGACLGLCVAISVAFVAVQCLEAWSTHGGWDVGRGTWWACFVAWGLCFAWAMRRPPVLAARDLLVAATVATAAIPLAHGLATGWWPWRAALSGQWALFGIDCTALAMAVAFGLLARAAARRGRTGDPNSVWTRRPSLRTS